MKKPICKICGGPHYATFCFRNRKPIKKLGKRSLDYSKWRNEVAYPYLYEKQAGICADCQTRAGIDLHHIKTRGSRPDLKYNLDNLVLLCRKCHQKRHNI